MISAVRRLCGWPRLRRPVERARRRAAVGRCRAGKRRPGLPQLHGALQFDGCDGGIRQDGQLTGGDLHDAWRRGPYRGVRVRDGARLIVPADASEAAHSSPRTGDSATW